MKRSVEKLACACFVLEHYALREEFSCPPSVIPIPSDSRIMDFYNELLKTNPRLNKFMCDDIFYITTHGKIVSNKDAVKLALQCGQLEDTGHLNGGVLYPNDIWPLP